MARPLTVFYLRGITQSSYKSDIRFRLLFKEAVKANIKITDAQLKSNSNIMNRKLRLPIF